MAGQDEGPAGGTPGSGQSHSLPGATFLPFGFAIGVALILIGVVVSWPVFWIGCAVAALFGLLWVADVVRGGRLPAPRPRPAHDDDDGERFGRDKFLEMSTLGIGALIGGAVTAPVVGFAIAPTFIGQGDDDVDLGPIENYPEGEFRVTTFMSKPEQGQVSTRTVFVRNNGFADGTPSFTIISNRCVHLGCPTQPGGPTNADEAVEVETKSGTVRLIPTLPASFVCPCHGGSYDIEGNRTAGPPVRALDRHTFKIVDGNLVLGDRYSVGTVEGTGASARIAAYDVYDPGQHVDGPTQWMYPLTPNMGR